MYMKKELKIQNGEPLHAWIDRLVPFYSKKEMTPAVLKDLLHEVSVASYIHGSNDAANALTGKPPRRLPDFEQLVSINDALKDPTGNKAFKLLTKRWLKE